MTNVIISQNNARVASSKSLFQLHDVTCNKSLHTNLNKKIITTQLLYFQNNYFQTYHLSLYHINQDYSNQMNEQYHFRNQMYLNLLQNRSHTTSKYSKIISLRISLHHFLASIICMKTTISLSIVANLRLALSQLTSQRITLRISIQKTSFLFSQFIFSLFSQTSSIQSYEFNILLSTRSKSESRKIMIENQIKNQSNFFTESTATIVERSKKKRIKQKNVKKTLKSIANMIDHSEISIEKLLMRQTITLSTLHLFQLFSHLRDETKRLINASRKSRKKKIDKINQAKTSIFKVNFTSVRSNKNKRVQ